jgi:hypothetical protein
MLCSSSGIRFAGLRWRWRGTPGRAESAGALRSHCCVASGRARWLWSGSTCSSAPACAPTGRAGSTWFSARPTRAASRRAAVGRGRPARRRRFGSWRWIQAIPWPPRTSWRPSCARPSRAGASDRTCCPARGNGCLRWLRARSRTSRARHWPSWWISRPRPRPRARRWTRSWCSSVRPLPRPTLATRFGWPMQAPRCASSRASGTGRRSTRASARRGADWWRLHCPAWRPSRPGYMKRSSRSTGTASQSSPARG